MSTFDGCPKCDLCGLCAKLVCVGCLFGETSCVCDPNQVQDIIDAKCKQNYQDAQDAIADGHWASGNLEKHPELCPCNTCFTSMLEADNEQDSNLRSGRYLISDRKNPASIVSLCGECMLEECDCECGFGNN